VAEEDVADGVLCLSARGRYQANYIRTHLVSNMLVTARIVDPAIAGLEITTRGN